MKKTVWFYAITMGAVGIFIWFLLKNGPETTAPVTAAFDSVSQNVWGGLKQQLHHPLAILLLQIISIILVARVLGTLFRKIGQPAVIGEIVAGIALGPSLLGWVWPEATSFLFPTESLGNLQLLSQMGLLLFMFVIGMELDTSAIRKKATEAVVISHASIVFPFALGVATSYFLYQRFAMPGISFTAFALFMGIGMSITAFPVLARIVQERGLTRTPLGNLVLTCAAADDVTAWCLLAGVIALVKAGAVAPVAITIGLSAAFVLIMFLIIKPFLVRLTTGRESKETVNKPVLAIIFLTWLGSAYIAEVIGIHALFGAFLAGVVMPDGFSFKKVIIDKIEDVALVLLLPLFFVFTGLRTEIGMVNTPQLWLICLGVTGVAVAGKLGGSALTARFLGQSWRDSLSIGVLMNTRGLMELVVLNIGYDLGILGPQIFTMMVFMALFTTFMTGPLLDLVNRFWREKVAIVPIPAANLLISFGKPSMGPKLLRLAKAFVANSGAKISALHVTPMNDISPADAHIFETESFAPLRKEAAQLDIAVTTIYRANEAIDHEILGIHDDLHPTLLLMGGAETMFKEQPMGLKIKRVLNQAACDVLVFTDHNFTAGDRIVIVYHDKNDLALLGYARQLSHNSQNAITVLALGLDLDALDHYMAREGHYYKIVSHQPFDQEFRQQYDLMLVNINQWEQILNNHPVEFLPSVLVLRQRKGNIPINTMVDGRSIVS